MDILLPILVIGGMGLVFGALLAVAAKAFAVKVDERVPKILNSLPGANCGGCGFAGCSAYADAIVKGEAKVNCCPVGGKAVADKISAIMGVESGEISRRFARVMCSGTPECAKSKFIYNGPQDCHSAAKLGGGWKACSYGCLGLGSCTKVCPSGAMQLKDGIAFVDRDKCIACGMCAKECPKGVIELVDAYAAYAVSCSSRDKGKTVRAFCRTGCIGCGICAKNCLADAITVENNIARIDPKKCVNCGMCAEKCPQKVIKFAPIPEEESLDEFVRV